MKYLNFAILTFASVFSLNTHASKCSDRVERFGKYGIQQFQMRTGCVIRLNHSDISKPRRNFQFFEKGLFEAYSIVPNQKGQDIIGSRSYFILPAPDKPTFEIIPGMMAKISDSSGRSWIIDENSELKEDGTCNIKNNRLTSMENEVPTQNGYYLKSCNSAIVIDLGFKRGEPANLHNPKAKATIRDSYGNSCSITNSEFFNYNPKEKGDYTWKFKSNTEIAKFIRSRTGCENIDTSSLYPKNSPSTKSSSGQR